VYKLRSAALYVFCFFLSSCSTWFFLDEPAFNYMWKQDVYNVLFEFVQDINDVKYEVLRKPKTLRRSPDRWACVKVNSKLEEETGCYAINVDNYSVTPVFSCTADYMASANKRKFHGIITDKGGASSFQMKGYLSDESRDKSYKLRIVEALFPLDSYDLTPNAQKKLLNLSGSLNFSDVKKVTVFGVADSSGNYQRNKLLSNKRANAVVDFLRENGFNNINIEKRYSVEQGLSAAEQRARQRRYTIRVELN